MKILNNIISEVKASPQEILRLRHFLVFVFFGIPTMVVFGLYNLFQGAYGLTFVILTSAASLAAGAFLQIRNPGSVIVFRVCTVFYSTLLLYMYVLGGGGGSKSLWLFTFPLIVFFLLGKKEGAVWTALLLGLIVFLHFLPSGLIEAFSYSDSYFIRLCSVYVIISCVTAWFEHFRTNYFDMNQLGNEKFMEILENSRDILYRRDFRSGKYTYISDSFNRELGYSKKETSDFVFKGVELLIHPDDRQAHNEYLDRIVNSSLQDTAENIEYRMRHKNGDYLWFSDKATVMYDRNGKPDHMIGINREITQIRKTQQALEKSHEQLVTILNSIDAHVYVADMESFNILFMNEKMKKDFGRNLEGGRCWKEFRNLDSPCQHCTNEKLLDEKNLPTGVHEWDTYNPIVKKWYRNYDRAIQWLDERWVRLQIAIDITKSVELEEERKKTEEMAQRNRQLEAIGSLAGGIAHDFNNILQIINGNADLIKDEKELTDSGYECLAEIKAASSKARELANRLISFSPGGKISSDPIDPASFLEEVTLLNITDSKVELRMRIEPSVNKMMANKRQLATAFANILSNSLDSMEENGLLEITASNYTSEEHSGQKEVKLAEGKYVRIDIKDNGRGIDPDDISRVFDPYFSTKEMSSIKGVGLGLSIAYSIIMRSEGELTINSAKGVGTLVSVYLPAC